jgi:hypothetical protein
MVDRSSLAVLSPAELTALRRVGRGFARHVPEHHQDTLVALGLVALDMGGRLVLTAKGQQRVRTADAETTSARYP